MAKDVATKEEWHEWCQNPVTQEMFDYFNNKINQETWDLVETAGTNVAVDSKRSGTILAFGEMLNWRPEAVLKEIAAADSIEVNTDET